MDVGKGQEKPPVDTAKVRKVFRQLKGIEDKEAALFYCPYIPLQMMKV